MNHRAKPNPASTNHVHHRDRGSAFAPDPGKGQERGPDDLAEALAESYVSAATSGEQHADQTLDVFVDEELGGPFLQEDGDVDLPPEGFDKLASSLRHELTTEPDVLGFEPHGARHSNSTPRPDRVKRGPPST
jgi:hypothetical protein